MSMKKLNYIPSVAPEKVLRTVQTSQDTENWTTLVYKRKGGLITEEETDMPAEMSPFDNYWIGQIVEVPPGHGCKYYRHYFVRID